MDKVKCGGVCARIAHRVDDVEGEAVSLQELASLGCLSTPFLGQGCIVPSSEEAQLVELSLAVAYDHELRGCMRETDSNKG